MGYVLAPGLSCCDAGGRYLFLDVRRDRYVCLSEASERSFRRLVEARALSQADRSVLDALVRQGMLSACEGEARPTPCLPPPEPRTSLLDGHLATPSAGRRIAVAARVVAARLDLKIHSLHAVLAGLVACKSAMIAAADVEDRLRVVGADFGAAGLLTSPLDQCLPRSIAAARWLIAGGVPAQLVIGVQLRPFGAHCWVQHGDRLVTDRVDAVRPFTPIQVI